MTEEKLKEIGKAYQDILESEFENYPSGSCYLSGHVLSVFFNKIGYHSKSISGSLALIDKNGKYVIYGKIEKLKGKDVGIYHTWCEVLIAGNCYILDPSIKYNKVTLKKYLNFKASEKIEDTIVTKEKETYYWKYIENDFFKKISDHSLSTLVSKDDKENVIKLLLEKCKMIDLADK